MATRAEALVEEFQRQVDEFAGVIERATDEQWQSVCGDEGWTVGQTAQHVAGQFPLEMEYITAAAEGRPMPSYTWDDINGKNDRRAADMRNATQAEVLQLLREGSSKAASYVRALSDGQLDRRFPLALADGAEVRTQDLIEGGVLIDHVRAHLKSIRAAGA